MRLTRSNIKILRTLIILIISAWGSVTVIKEKPWTKNNDIVEVIKVKDGDSVIIQTPKGQKDLRIWGIDAPERGQSYAPEAKKRLEQLVLNKNVKVQNPKTDDFHRDLAFISVTNNLYPNGLDVGSILISEGLAWHFNPDPQHDKPYQKLEQEARNKKLGLWKDQKPKPPEEFRREQKNKSPKTFRLNKKI